MPKKIWSFFPALLGLLISRAMCPNPSIRINPLTHRNMLVPCRKCIQCRVSARLPWELRLRHELARHGYIGSFVTMTYSDDKYDVRQGLNYQHLKKYWHDLRKAGYRFTYYCVGEYGCETARCHYHALLFGIDPSERKNLFDIWGKCYYPRFTATQITNGRIRYTLKYMDKETVSFSDWSNMFPDKVRALYHVDSGRITFCDKGPVRPRAWLSHSLGRVDLTHDLQSTFYDGRIHYGQSVYSAPHYYQDCVSRNDIFYQYNRQFFDERNSVNAEKRKFHSLNDYYFSQVENARLDERDYIRESHLHGKPADDSYLKSSVSLRSIMDCDFDSEFYNDSSRSYVNESNRTRFPVTYDKSIFDDALAYSFSEEELDIF